MAGINALFGPLHGGANQSVLEVLEGIHSSGGDVGEFVKKVKDKEDDIKLMGRGHRLYKNYDPRAAIVKKSADEVLRALGKRNDLLDIAIELEQHALEDDYFVERKLYPNVDFYTGLIHRAMGFPTRMFTVLFAIGRLRAGPDRPVERDDQRQDDPHRPAASSTGHTEREFVQVDKR